jgi:hypothetical protein
MRAFSEHWQSSLDTVQWAMNRWNVHLNLLEQGSQLTRGDCCCSLCGVRYINLVRELPWTMIMMHDAGKVRIRFPHFRYLSWTWTITGIALLDLSRLQTGTILDSLSFSMFTSSHAGTLSTHGLALKEPDDTIAKNKQLSEEYSVGWLWFTL